MAAARRIKRVQFNTGKVVERGRKVMSDTLDQVAGEMTARLKELYGTPGPPRSVRGQFPHIDTGNLNAQIGVQRKGRQLWIRTPLYGVFLQEGFRHHQSGRKIQRKGYREALWRKDGSNRLSTRWVKRINQLSKQKARRK